MSARCLALMFAGVVTTAAEFPDPAVDLKPRTGAAHTRHVRVGTRTTLAKSATSSGCRA